MTDKITITANICCDRLIPAIAIADGRTGSGTSMSWSGGENGAAHVLTVPIMPVSRWQLLDWVETSFSGTYNEGVYPLVINEGSEVEEVWTLTFLYQTELGGASFFALSGERLGWIATGNIEENFSPINSLTGEPFFTILSAGWGGSWLQGDTITFKTHSSPSAIVITAKLLATSDSNAAKVFACAGYEDLLGWDRKVEITLDNNKITEIISRDAYITITLAHPEAVCQWTRTNLIGVRKAGSREVYFTAVPSTAGGLIPESGPLHGIDFDVSVTNSQTQMVPGESLQLEWILTMQGQTLEGVVATAWFDSPAITGGEITGETGEGVGKTLTVQAVGRELTLVPTDFAGYEIGDWVFLLKQGFGPASETDRETEYGESDVPGADPADTGLDAFRPVPMTVNSYGPEGTMETLDFDMLDAANFRKFFEVSHHVGVITAIGTDDTADITVADFGGAAFSDVPIFYHCENAEDTTGGAAAFAVGDEVLVLNEFGGAEPDATDLTIVGFPAGLKLCATEYLKISSTVEGVTYVLLYNLKNKTLFTATGAPEFPIAYDGDAEAWFVAHIKAGANTEVVSLGESVGYDGFHPGTLCLVDPPVTHKDDVGWCTDLVTYPDDSFYGVDVKSHLGTDPDTQYGISTGYVSIAASHNGYGVTEDITRESFVNITKKTGLSRHIEYAGGDRSFVVSADMDATYHKFNSSIQNWEEFLSLSFHSPFEATAIHSESTHELSITTPVEDEDSRAEDVINFDITAGCIRGRKNIVGWCAFQYEIATRLYGESVDAITTPEGFPYLAFYTESDITEETEINPFEDLFRDTDLDQAVRDLLTLSGGSVGGLVIEFINSNVEATV